MYTQYMCAAISMVYLVFGMLYLIFGMLSLMFAMVFFGRRHFFFRTNMWLINYSLQRCITTKSRERVQVLPSLSTLHAAPKGIGAAKSWYYELIQIITLHIISCWWLNGMRWNFMVWQCFSLQMYESAQHEYYWAAPGAGQQGNIWSL